MQIIYDAEIFRRVRTGGIVRYFTGLITRLPLGYEPCLDGMPSDKSFGSDLRGVRTCLIGQDGSIRAGACADPGLTVGHPTYYDLTQHSLLKRGGIPIVVTLHDLTYFRYSHELDASGSVKVAITRALSAADWIICISETTRCDLLNRFPRFEGKCSVVHHAADVTSKTALDQRRNFARRYFLYVGSRASYKNFYLVLGAFAKLAQKVTGLQFCIVGPPLTEKERWRIFELGIRDRVTAIQEPSDPILASLYRYCEALLYPSHWEGFGIPPIEAMACGAIPIVAAGSCMGEVVSFGGIVLDPMREDDWVEAMWMTMVNQNVREKFIEAGRARAAMFTWNETLRGTLEAYHRAIGGFEADKCAYMDAAA